VTTPWKPPASLREAAAVFRIDLRAAAAGPDAADADSIDAGTLEALQRRSPGISMPNGQAIGAWRIVDIERLLIVDDAAEFSKHADAYQYLVEAPTFGRMLCLIFGQPADPPFLDVPPAVGSTRAPVLWIGDLCGVGWQMGRSGTTRLAVNDADPDGVRTAADLIESLTSTQVFDEMTKAIDGLPGRTAVAALLPWISWPASTQAGNDEPEDPAPAAAAQTGPAAHDIHAAPDTGTGRRVTLARVALALGCALAAAAAGLAIALRLGTGYLVADITLAVAGLLLIAYGAWRTVSARRHQPPPPASPAPPGPVRPPAPHDQVPDGILAHARWIMSAAAGDDSFRQLSSPDQLVMLGGESQPVTLVKFAPATARHLIDTASDADFVAWTTVGDQVGVIRLVPIKAGLVRIS
jgi:hypothetical protein